VGDGLELRAIEALDERLHVELAPFYRHSSGLIRMMGGRFANTGALEIFGVSFAGRGRVHRRLEVGGGYEYLKAQSKTADEPLDFLFHHKLDGWIRVNPAGTITVFTGKCEFGQGILTALVQIAAEELDVAYERVEIVSADTAQTPNEGMTAGSLSVENSGTALRFACAEARQILLKLAAAKLGETPEIVGGQAYFITDDESINGLEWFRPLVEGLGHRWPTRRLPGWLVYRVAALLEWIHFLRGGSGPEPTLTRRGVLNLTRDGSFRIDRARKELGYEPKIHAADGLAALLPDARRLYDACLEGRGQGRAQ